MADDDTNVKRKLLEKRSIIELQIEPRVDSITSDEWVRMRGQLIMVTLERLQKISYEIRGTTAEEAMELIDTELSSDPSLK